MRFLHLALLPLLCTCGPALHAQLQSPETTAWLARLSNLPDTFRNLGSAMNVRLNAVLDLDFKPKEVQQNDYLEDHLVLYSKEEKLEMRFHLRPESSSDPLSGMPHLRTQTIAMNLGSNEEGTVTTVHSFDGEELTVFNADWARMYTFRPKRSYSDRAHAQLIAIYREDRGLAFAVLLFDKIPPTIEDRQLTIRFQ